MKNGFGTATKLADEIVDSRQEWRTSLDAYVRHFTSSLELEYEAERQAVLEKVQKRSTRQLQVRLGSGWRAMPMIIILLGFYICYSILL